MLTSTIIAVASVFKHHGQEYYATLTQRVLRNHEEKTAPGRLTNCSKRLWMPGAPGLSQGAPENSFLLRGAFSCWRNRKSDFGIQLWIGTTARSHKLTCFAVASVHCKQADRQADRLTDWQTDWQTFAFLELLSQLKTLIAIISNESVDPIKIDVFI